MPEIYLEKTLNREAQERWDDDGGAIPLDLATQNSEPKGPETASISVVGADERRMLLDHLEVANRYFSESEHRIARQQNLISRLRAKRRATISAIEFLRSLQASRVVHRAGCSRLRRALAILDVNGGTIEPVE